MKIRTLLKFALFGLIFSFPFLSPSEAGDLLKLKAVGTIQAQDDFERLSQTRPASGLSYFVLQFHSTIRAFDQQLLKQSRVSVLKYLPEDALIVRAKIDDLRLLRSLNPNLRAVSDYLPEWKLSPELLKETGAGRTLLLISVLDPEAVPSVLSQLREIQGAKITSFFGRDLYLEVDRNRVTELARIEGVEWIESAPLLQTFVFSPGENTIEAPQGTPPALTGYESGTKLMNFEAAWNRGLRGERQIVAVGDTGLDIGAQSGIHPDFAASLLKGYALGMGSESWEDPMGHGTHVSGSIAGTGAASHQQIHGGALGGKLIMESLWSPILDGLAPGMDFDRLFGTAYKDGARVHSNSWGAAAMGDYDTLASRVDEYMWKNPEMLIVFAAGNGGVDANQDGVIDLDSVSSPGTAKNVLTVGASKNYLLQGGIQRKLVELRDGAKNWGVEPLASDTLSNNPNGIACFSSRGPTDDGRNKPDIVAPGTNIVSARSHHPKAELLWGEYDANYLYAGGTSMATPLTAGAAALVRQFLVEKRGIPTPSAALVKGLLIHTATDLYPGEYGTGPKQEIPQVRPNPQEGYGRVDMDFATRLGKETLLIDEKGGVAVSEEKTYEVNVPAGATLRATLVYTDAPAAASAAKALVNEIELKVVRPDGSVLVTGDHINNAKMIEIPDASAGRYKVSVAGVNIPRGTNARQPYSLIVGTY